MNQQTERNFDKGNIKHNILTAISFTIESFLHTEDWESSINKILQHLGKAIDVSRVYIFENTYDDNGLLVMNQRFEWANEGISPQITNQDLIQLPYTQFPEWEKSFLQNENIVGNTIDFNDTIREILEPQQTKSIALVPIFSDNTWWGFIGFDECAKERNWDTEVMELLKIVSNIIGATIARHTI
ncbi:MAG: GAF domain-containing protein, partial [Bacteroidota bacterium]|nr:GAF domain-containing protein [Bacteroidota bacterium]